MIRNKMKALLQIVAMMEILCDHFYINIHHVYSQVLTHLYEWSRAKQSKQTHPRNTSRMIWKQDQSIVLNTTIPHETQSIRTWSPKAWRPTTMDCVQPGTRRGIVLQMIGSRNTVPPRMLRIVPFGLSHIFFSLNSVEWKHSHKQWQAQFCCYKTRLLKVFCAFVNCLSAHFGWRSNGEYQCN